MNRKFINNTYFRRNGIFLIILMMLSFKSFGQDLDKILDGESVDQVTFTLGTFNGTRLLNGHSIETRKKGILEFLIHHRFGKINSGFDELFGLDQSNIRFGLEYAITDDFTAAVGRSSFQKTFDGYLKYRLIKQKVKGQSSPISLTLLLSATEKTIKDYEPEDKPSFTDRLTYSSQLLIARKFGPSLSVQLSPTYIHFNEVPDDIDPKDIFALGIGTRVKISKRVSINAEYFYAMQQFESIDAKNSLAFGVDIETGGHIFQLILANSRSMIEKGFIAETTGDFFDGDIHFGFNISRAFQLSAQKTEEKQF